ncbi:PEP-utilizing enzyme [Streptomyces sp. TG1A-60]|uniref:PEP-utilizing enzyme n=1 Tax=Streptomyces sp. TG1A-60 TaxID=3129111 RepID=UPI0030CD1116
MQELLHPQLRLTGGDDLLVRGLPASPGAATGVVVLSSERALELAADGRQVVLVAAETTPGDVPGMLASAAVLTGSGGIASHAAVVARGAGKPAVCGAEGLRVDLAAGTVRFGERVVREGDPVSLDGRTGAVYGGTLSVSVAGPPPELSTLLEWGTACAGWVCGSTPTPPPRSTRPSPWARRVSDCAVRNTSSSANGCR